MRVCPKCGRHYDGYPALSRRDNKTEICPTCGILEALEAAGVSEEERKRMLDEYERLTELYR